MSFRPGTLAVTVIVPSATLSLRSTENAFGRLLSASATHGVVEPGLIVLLGSLPSVESVAKAVAWLVPVGTPPSKMPE